ncbi:phosphotransferase family protein [Sphaerisporangium fuscum]|uniref:phosphotransferase family protein n=1 Tax=Sphaerisporangium fuscum TaxID=2835868 RepID=UPI001BDDC076|nr:aminoglycoside phosphotransferase family protein [Sphaerisporangium fuscum]
MTVQDGADVAHGDRPGRDGASGSPPPPPDIAAKLAGIAGDGPFAVLKDTRVTVVRVGDVVVKAHPADTDEAALTARVRAARALPGLFLPPLDDRVRRVEGRPVTLWPTGEPVDPSDPDAAPWEPAAELLARLHAVQAAGLPSLPPAGGPARLLRAVASLDGLDSAYAAGARAIREAFRSLPPGAAATVPGTRLAHGDWHLGQIVRYEGEWLLIDVDDLGAGSPAWDLARPAAWYATGFLAPEVWQRFLAAYTRAGGSAVSQADPWRELDVPARALTVQLAATAVAAAGAAGVPLGEVERSLVSSCGRIARTPAAQ